MGARQVLYNSITVNLPKNLVQLLLGATLFCVISGTINLPVILLAMLGLALAYSSVYMYNDIIDREEDAADDQKRPWKPVANGTLSVEGAISIYALLILSGLFVSFMVNFTFGAMMAAILFLNFLHSSHSIRLKKRKWPTVINITVIEFIKYSSGWFALTSDVASFPAVLILMFSLIYTMCYIAYKFKFSGRSIKDNKLFFGGMGFVVFLLFMGSLVLYSFPLSLITLFILSAAVFLIRHKFWSHKKGFNEMLILELILLPLLIVCFLMLNIPAFGEANAQLVAFLNAVVPF